MKGNKMFSRRRYFDCCSLILTTATLALASGLAPLAHAAPYSDDATSAPAVTPAELQRQIDVLGQEVQKLKIGSAAAEPTADQETWGFGPAASKVYRSQPGVTLGGYGEVLFQSYRNGYNGAGKQISPGFDTQKTQSQSNIDLGRAVLYAGYRFNDHWILNSEFEWEHSGYVGGDEQDGSSSEVEFLSIDYLYSRELNFRAGKLLMPVGLTNETHEPTTYLSTLRPLLETLIIPTTWTEYGVGVFGEAGPFTYRTYAVTGLSASGFTSSSGIGGGKNEVGYANATRWGWVARGDYTAIPGLLAGGSFFLGEATTNVDSVNNPNQLSVPTQVFEVHAQYNWHALDLRAMGAYTLLNTSDVATLDSLQSFTGSQSVGSRQGGFYLQAGYDVLSGHGVSLMPFARWETVDTQISVPMGYTTSGSNLIRVAVAGIDFKPIPQLVFKADYEWFMIGDGSGVDQFNAGIGYVF
jgi:hypothetical protein